MTIGSWLQQAQQQLAIAGSLSPAMDARLLLSHVLNKPSSYFFAWPETQLENAQQERLAALLARRVEGEPIAYLLGKQAFYGRDFKVTPATLIPRPDTELLVERALALAPSCTTEVLDLGTGSGAIALTLALERPHWRVCGVDNSEEALAVAKENGVKLGATNCEFMLSHWFSALKGQRYHVIVSNPPYVAPEDEHLTRGDVRFEPKTALVAEQEGYADIRDLVQQAKHYLHAGGMFMVEHGYTQGAGVRTLMQEAGWQGVQTEQDYGERDRVTYGYAP